MAQGPVDQQGTRSRSLSLMDLPPAIRQTIYREAGVLTESKIFLLPSGDRTVDPEDPVWSGRDLSDEETPPPPPSGPTISLMQTCRALHDDVLALILSRNTVTILPSALEFGLEYIARLPPHLCRAAARLEVYLQDYGCVYPLFYPSQQEEMDSTEAELTASKVDLWHTAAARLLSQVAPGNTTLWLICDLQSDPELSGPYSLAPRIVAPLLEAAPGTLASCDIRLSMDKPNHPETRQLANMAAQAARHVARTIDGARPRSEPFRFMDLPQEIRLSILEYTDLVTPYRQVNWHPALGFYCSWAHRSCLYHADDPSPEIKEEHAVCEHRFCGSRRRGWNRFGNGIPRAWLTSNSARGVEWSRFCRTRYCAFNASCRCWGAPMDLMLVSHDMYHDAIKIFYSRNRITVVGIGGGPIEDDGYPAPLDRHPPLLDAATFINRHMWPQVLRHIRTLELFFPTFSRYSRPVDMDDHCYADWLNAIAYLGAYANLEGLTVIVHMSERDEDLSITVAMMPDVRFAIEEEVHLPRWLERVDSNRYRLLMYPLAATLSGRAERVLVYLETKWHFSADCRCQEVGKDPEMAKMCVTLREREAQMEEWLMGDKYDATAPEKTCQPPLHWLRRMRGFMG